MVNKLKKLILVVVMVAIVGIISCNSLYARQMGPVDPPNSIKLDK